MLSLPGGPSISSVCIHAEWTMGTVKDVYMQYLSIIRRSVCWSLSGDVALIADGVCIFPPPPPPPPPHFVPVWNGWGKTYRAQQFPMFDDVPQFVHIKLMCLASMVKHRQFIVECFNANHVVLASGQLF